MTMISVNVEVTLNLPESGLSVKKLQKKYVHPGSSFEANIRVCVNCIGV